MNEKIYMDDIFGIQQRDKVLTALNKTSLIHNIKQLKKRI